MIRVKTQYGYLEYVRPKSVFQEQTRAEAEEMAQVELVLGYLKKYPAENSADDEEIINWLKRRGVKIHA